MGKFIDSSDVYRKIVGAGVSQTDIMDPVINMFVMILSMLSAIPVITIINRFHSEERRGRAEQIYSKSVSRSKNLLRLFSLSIIVAALQQVAIAVGIWCAADMSMEEPLKLGVMFTASMNYLPALVLFAGAACMLCGLIPKISGLSWFVLTTSFLFGYLGNLIDFPEWTKKINPFTALSKYPAEDISAAPIIILCIVGIVLMAIGTSAFKRRDLITQ
jgi:ABC-2 type transport system permease protein